MIISILVWAVLGIFGYSLYRLFEPYAEDREYLLDGEDLVAIFLACLIGPLAFFLGMICLAAWITSKIFSSGLLNKPIIAGGSEKRDHYDRHLERKEQEQHKLYLKLKKKYNKEY